jgi:hypothetical protein
LLSQAKELAREAADRLVRQDQHTK